MLRVVSCDNESYKNKLRKYLETNVLRSQKNSNSVRKIIMNVKEGGDKSLLKLTNKYENNNFTNISEIEVPINQISNLRSIALMIL